jgi:hypothetical protein
MVETILGQPRPFELVSLQRQSTKLLNGLAQFGITASDISLKRNDELYDYELNIRMFRGAGHFRLGSDKGTTTLKDARTTSDIATVRECVAKLSSLLDFPPGMVSTVIIEVHANLLSQTRIEYFSKLMGKLNAAIPEGAVIYRNSPGFQGDIRLAVERSNFIINPHSISIFWNGAIIGLPTEATIQTVDAEIDAGLKQFNLEFKKG